MTAIEGDLIQAAGLEMVTPANQVVSIELRGRERGKGEGVRIKQMSMMMNPPPGPSLAPSDLVSLPQLTVVAQFLFLAAVLPSRQLLFIKSSFVFDVVLSHAATIQQPWRPAATAGNRPGTMNFLYLFPSRTL